MSDEAITKSQTPERMSALVSSELLRFNIDTACISECLGEDKFVDGDYTFLHSGRPPG